MAAVVRRTWAQLRDEALLGLGNPSTTGMSGRVEYWMWAVFQDLWTTYHHFEGDTIDTTKALSTSNNEVTLPTGTFIVVNVRLKAVAGTILGPLKYEEAHILFSEYKAGTAAQPARYTRVGSKLYVDALPDVAYPLELLIYATPTRADFSSGSPATAEDMDEHLIDGTLRRANPKLGRPDLGAVQRELLTEWLGQQVRPDLLSLEIPGLPERQLTDKTFSGAQG